jgi:hypothetical protein
MNLNLPKFSQFEEKLNHYKISCSLRNVISLIFSRVSLECGDIGVDQLAGLGVT